jgi:hypothetical protein
VATHAALGHEQVKSLLLGRVERILLAGEVLVEARLRGNQRRFERFDRARHVLERYDIFFSGESLLKVLHIRWYAAKRLHGTVGIAVHLDCRLNRTHGLLFQVLRTAIPKLGDIEDGIQNRWTVSRTLLPAVADGSLEQVDAAETQVVTCIATDQPTRREPRIKEEHLAEFYFGRVRRIRLQGRRRGRYRLEGSLGFLHKRILGEYGYADQDR